MLAPAEFDPTPNAVDVDNRPGRLQAPWVVWLILDPDLVLLRRIEVVAEDIRLLLRADLDSVAAVSSALRSPDKLREDLRDLARGWAVVAPGEEEIGAWGRHLGVPQH